MLLFLSACRHFNRNQNKPFTTLTKTDIINLITTDKEYLRISRKIAKGNDLQNDLYQEFIIVMIEYNEGKLIEVFKKGQLKFFCTGIMQRMYYNKNSPFYKMHKKFIENIDSNIPEIRFEESENNPEINIPKLIELGNELKFETTLLLLSVEMGSVVEVSKQTGIEKDAIHKAIKRAKKQIKKQYENTISNSSEW